MPAADRWGFRVASRPEDGWGHVMRCLTLASEVQGDVTFFVDPNPIWERRLKVAGHQVRVEPEPHAAIVLRQEVPRMDGCLFDGYTFGNEIAKAAEVAFVAQVMDVPDASAADFVLAPGLGAEDWQFGAARSAAGAHFALLRPEFSNAHDQAMHREAAKAVGHVLISFGGRDGSNLSALAIDAVARLACCPRVTVVMAVDAPHRADVERRANEIGAVVLTQVEDMASLYLSADLAVGGGGVSLLERLCCGLPSLLVVQAENQIPNASTAQALGLSRVVGLNGPVEFAAIVGAIELLSGDADIRSDMRRRGLELIDGRGAQRAARALKEAVHPHVDPLPL